MDLFKEIYGIVKDTEEGKNIGLDVDTILRLVDEDVIPRRYSSGPGVGYPSKEEEEEALALDNDSENMDDEVIDVEDGIDADVSDTSEFSMDENLPEQILSYARDLIKQGLSVEEAARQVTDTIYDELVSELQNGDEECVNCDEEPSEFDSEDVSGEEDYETVRGV